MSGTRSAERMREVHTPRLSGEMGPRLGFSGKAGGGSAGTLFLEVEYFRSCDGNKEQPRIWSPAASTSEPLGWLPKHFPFLFAEKLTELYVRLSSLSLPDSQKAHDSWNLLNKML